MVHRVARVQFHLKVTRATIDVHHFFSEVPQFVSLRPLPEADLEKQKLLPDEKCHGLCRLYDENHAK